MSNECGIPPSRPVPWRVSTKLDVEIKKLTINGKKMMGTPGLFITTVVVARSWFEARDRGAAALRRDRSEVDVEMLKA